MTARFKGTRDADFYRAQSAFVNDLATFARSNGVHVHLVAHPKKTDQKHLAADDVGGIGDITNFADNVFALERTQKGEAGEGQTVLNILKNRFYGVRKQIGLTFDETSRRFYKSGTGDPNRHYGWELTGRQIRFPEDDDEENPFLKEGGACR